MPSRLCYMHFDYARELCDFVNERVKFDWFRTKCIIPTPPGYTLFYWVDSDQQEAE